MNAIHEALARHDEEHYYLSADDPAVLACVFCDGGDDSCDGGSEQSAGTGHAD